MLVARIAARPPFFAMWGPGRASAAHAHHALHLVLAVEGRLRFSGAGRGRAARAAGVVTSPDVVHAIDARGVDVAIVFVELESEHGARLASALAGALRAIGDDERDELVALLRARPGGDALAAVELTVQRLHGAVVPPPTMHPRVRRVLRHLERDDVDTSLPAMAKVAGLSSSRLVHAFTESTGISLRAFLLWRKVQRAGGALAGGAPLSVVAHAAGFADAAHLTRTFRRTFGVTPSELREAMRAAGVKPP